MKNPTHFIEVYNGTTGGVCKNSHGALPISMFDENLKWTLTCKLVTIAIWKIKSKWVISKNAANRS